MADPLYTYVPIDALRALVEYADAMRDTVLEQHGRPEADRIHSAEVFRARVTALGVPGLLPDEDGAG